MYYLLLDGVVWASVCVTNDTEEMWNCIFSKKLHENKGREEKKTPKDSSVDFCNSHTMRCAKMKSALRKHTERNDKRKWMNLFLFGNKRNNGTTTTTIIMYGNITKTNVNGMVQWHSYVHRDIYNVNAVQYSTHVEWI